MEIYHDSGKAFGRRTRFVRDAEGGGVEWMYGADYASGDTRWYALSPSIGTSIDAMKRAGMFLSRLDG